MLTSDRVCISECCYISARVVVLCFGLFASHRHAPSLEVIPDAPVYCSRLNTSEIDTSIFRYLDFQRPIFSKSAVNILFLTGTHPHLR